MEDGEVIEVWGVVIGKIDVTVEEVSRGRGGGGRVKSEVEFGVESCLLTIQVEEIFYQVGKKEWIIYVASSGAEFLVEVRMLLV